MSIKDGAPVPRGEDGLTDDERTKMYRRTFSGKDGEATLNNILFWLGFFDDQLDPQNVQGIARSNYAKQLLGHLGVYNVKNLHNGRLTKAFMGIQYIQKGGENGNSTTEGTDGKGKAGK